MNRQSGSVYRSKRARKRKENDSEIPRDLRPWRWYPRVFSGSIPPTGDAHYNTVCLAGNYMPCQKGCQVPGSLNPDILCSKKHDAPLPNCINNSTPLFREPTAERGRDARPKIIYIYDLLQDIAIWKRSPLIINPLLHRNIVWYLQRYVMVMERGDRSIGKGNIRFVIGNGDCYYQTADFHGNLCFYERNWRNKT